MVELLSEFTESQNGRYRFAIARCRCGGEYRIKESIYNRGRSSTCGCAKKQDKHGYHKTILYSRWESMKQRCTYPKHASYRNYGAIGITVCDEWQKFIPFKNWAESNNYQPDLELDRIDTGLGYSPDNCRWVTHSFNNRNKRNNRLINIDGVNRTITEWAEIYGMPVNTFKNRIQKWGIQRAITTPIKNNEKVLR